MKRRVLVPVYIVSWETRRVASVGSNGFVDGFSDGYVCCAEFIKIVQ
jgi:hypothetical protein